MSVEIRGDITTIIEKQAKLYEPKVVIWTIGNDSIQTSDIDKALREVFPGSYEDKRKKGRKNFVDLMGI